MNRHMVAYPASSHDELASLNSRKADLELRGRWLVIARIAWMLLFAANAWGFGMSVVAYIAAVKRPCMGPSCAVTPAQAVSLQHLGISLDQYATLSASMAIAVALTGASMALALFWRSNSWIALVVGLFLFLFPVDNFSNVSGTVIVPVIDFIVGLADLILSFSVFMIFPDGRFVPRWTWLIVVAWVVFHIALNVSTAPWIYIGYPVLYLSAIAVQIYRYLRVSDAIQRQQTRLVLFGFTVTLLANILYWIALPALFPVLQASGSLYSLVGFPLYMIVTLILPISFAIAIQRFHLFDVDVLINRALVYGSLTAILGALYFGLIVGAQMALRLATGQQSPQPQVVLVLSTLLIAALFQPLRTRLQTAIDRRFYRRKYDAARTLAQFSATLRSEVELSQLSASLLDVVEETMQPERVSLWLREPPSGETASSRVPRK